MKLVWRGGKNGFNPANLTIRFRDGGGRWAIWTPSVHQTHNLGGTLGSLDGCNGPEPLPDGVLSRNGWFLFRDNTFLVGNGPHGWICPRPVSEIDDWYFFGYGKNHYHTALRDLITISGRIPIPPRYALGTWRSRYHSFTANEFKQLVLEYNHNKIPLDVMVMDMGWHTTPHWGSMDWNKKLIPHPARLLAWLHRHGIYVTVNWHPDGGVGPWYSQYRAFRKALGLPPGNGTIPFEDTSRKFMHYYHKLLMDPIEKQGVDFWWLDGGIHLGWDNATTFNNIGRPSTGHRGMSFSRWGGWGDQRYPISFSGDTRSLWRVLRFEIYFTSTSGNVGADYWSHDMGGFAVYIPTADLYTRWMEFGAFAPIFRTHNEGSFGDHRRPWYYGQRVENAVRRAYDLRARLLPYIYTCAYRCWQRGIPLLRPLYLANPTANQAYTHHEEYQFGPALLVAPITARGIGKDWLGGTSMWFPRGTWWNLITGESVTQSGDKPILATADQIPVFVRGGVPIPEQPVKMRMTTDPAHPLVVQVFPGKQGNFTLYEDDGVTPDYLHGDYALTPLHYRASEKAGVRITVGPTKGWYRGQPQRREVIIRLPVTTRPQTVRLDGTDLPYSSTAVPGYCYDPVSVTTVIRLPKVSIRKQLVVSATFRGSRAVQLLLPKVLNRIALLHRALGGAGEYRVGWKFEADRLLFNLQTLRSLAAQEFGTATAAEVQQRLAELNGRLASLQSKVCDYRGIQATAAGFALDNCFMRTAAKLRQESEGVRDFDKSRFYKTYSGINNIEGFRVGLWVHAILPPKAINPCLDISVPGLKKQKFKPQPTWSNVFAYVPFADATDHPLYNFKGWAKLKFKDGANLISIRRAVHMRRELLDRWSMVGPFDYHHAPAIQNLELTPAVLDRTYKVKGGNVAGWRSAAVAVRHVTQYSSHRWVNVRRLYPVDNACAFATTWVKAPADLSCRIRVHHDDGIELWANGTELINSPSPMGYAMSEPPAVATLQLHKGWNEIEVKTYQLKWDWGFSVVLNLPEGVVCLQASEPPEPGVVKGNLMAPTASSAQQPISLADGASEWAYFDYVADGRSRFIKKMYASAAIGRALQDNDRVPSTGTDSQMWLTFHGGTPVASAHAARSFAYVAGAGQSIHFTTHLIASNEIVKLYLTSFDAKMNITATLGRLVKYVNRGIVLSRYYDPQRDGDGTGSGHGYAILRLNVSGAIGDRLKITGSVNLSGVRRTKYGSVGFQAVSISRGLGND